MSVQSASTTPQAHYEGNEPAYSGEAVSLASVDYVPTNAAGAVVIGRYLLIATATGTVKIDTPGGDTVTIPSGLATGVLHAISFTKIYKTGTTATGLVAFT